jgi:hypothetical protein
LAWKNSQTARWDRKTCRAHEILEVKKKTKKGRFKMFTGSIIDDLIATVERAELRASFVQMRKPEVAQLCGLPAGASSANTSWENWAGVA